MTKEVSFSLEDEVHYYDSYIAYYADKLDDLEQIWYTNMEYATMNFERLDTIERMCILDDYVDDDDDDDDDDSEYCTVGLEIPKDYTKRLLEASYSKGKKE